MNRKVIAAVGILLILLVFVIFKFRDGNDDMDTIDNPVPDVASIGFSIIKSYPHNPKSFTQGLMIYNGELYEGTGMNNESRLMKVDLQTGETLKEVKLDSVYFGEGITILNDTIYQLTWQNKKVFVYDMDFKKINEFDLSTEGWGLTSDGKNMIVSDGSNNLYYYNPTNFSLVETKAISEAGSPAFNLNELEYISGYIYAKQWLYPYILKIDPAQSTVVGKIDLTDISKRIRSQSPGAEFLNGIAYDSTNNKMYVTGKYWPTLFEIQMAQ